jgi:hypothetical protein
MLLSVLQEVFPFEILLVTLPPSCEPGRYEYPELLFPLALLTEKLKRKINKDLRERERVFAFD